MFNTGAVDDEAVEGTGDGVDCVRTEYTADWAVDVLTGKGD